MGAQDSSDQNPLVDKLNPADRQLLALAVFAEPSADGEMIAASDDRPGFVWEKWAIAILVGGVIANGLYQALAMAGVVE